MGPDAAAEIDQERRAHHREIANDRFHLRDGLLHLGVAGPIRREKEAHARFVGDQLAVYRAKMDIFQ